MEAIIAASIGAATKLIELIFLGFKAPHLTQTDIEKEIKRIEDKEKKLISKWWSMI